MDKLHYKGQISPAPGQLYGPDLWGANYTMESHEYDPQTDTSTAYFKPHTGVKVSL